MRLWLVLVILLFSDMSVMSVVYGYLGFIRVTIWAWCIAMHVIGIGDVEGDQLCSMGSRRVTCGFHVFVMN